MIEIQDSIDINSELVADISFEDEQCLACMEMIYEIFKLDDKEYVE